MSERVCPLYFRRVGQGTDAGAKFAAKCLKEECMFWIPEAGQCSIPVLARQALGLKQGEGAGLAFTAVSRQ